MLETSFPQKKFTAFPVLQHKKLIDVCVFCRLQIAQAPKARLQIAQAAEKWAACPAITQFQRRDVEPSGTRLADILKTNQTPRTSLHSNSLQNISKVRERLLKNFILQMRIGICMHVAMSESPEVCQFSSTEAMHLYTAKSYLHQIECKDFID